jgi:predicted DNA-binding ArsR family transcriptional regulator
MNLTLEIRNELSSAITKENLEKLFYEEIDSAWLDETTKENYKALKQPNSILIKIATTIFNKDLFKDYRSSIARIALQGSGSISDSKEVANILMVYFSKEEIQGFLEEIDESILGNNSKVRYNRQDF